VAGMPGPGSQPFVLTPPRRIREIGTTASAEWPQTPRRKALEACRGLFVLDDVESGEAQPGGVDFGGTTDAFGGEVADRGEFGVLGPALVRACAPAFLGPALVRASAPAFLGPALVRACAPAFLGPALVRACAPAFLGLAAVRACAPAPLGDHGAGVLRPQRLRGLDEHERP